MNRSILNAVFGEADKALFKSIAKRLGMLEKNISENPGLTTEQLGIDPVAGATTKYLSEKGTMEEVPVATDVIPSIETDNVPILMPYKFRGQPVYRKVVTFSTILNLTSSEAQGYDVNDMILPSGAFILLYTAFTNEGDNVFATSATAGQSQRLRYYDKPLPTMDGFSDAIYIDSDADGPNRHAIFNTASGEGYVLEYTTLPFLLQQ